MHPTVEGKPGFVMGERVMPRCDLSDAGGLENGCATDHGMESAKVRPMQQLAGSKTAFKTILLCDANV
jgi:hypothetical protein